MSAAVHDWTGTILDGTYRLDRLLGEGGMGTVYRAQQLRTGQEVAVKLLNREAAADAGIYRRFQDEARIATRLDHPNIVSVLDFAEHSDGTPYMVMELLNGEDLANYLKRHPRLPLSEVIAITTQVADALQAAHDAGIVHRDIKPQNLFLNQERDGSQRVKVVDFGISKIRDRTTQLTQTSMLMGTPQYMSPEMARGQHADLDGRSDQFSLAVMVYRLLAGQLPFQSGNMHGFLYQIINEDPPPLASLAPGLPPHVPLTVARALAKRREDRFPTMRNFMAALRGEVPVIALPPTIIRPAQPLPATAAPVGSTTFSSASGQRPDAAPVTRRAILSGAGAALLVAGAWALRPRPTTTPIDSPRAAPPTTAASVPAPPQPTPSSAAPTPASDRPPLPDAGVAPPAKPATPRPRPARPSPPKPKSTEPSVSPGI